MPKDFHGYPSKKQFINYLENYPNKFEIDPQIPNISLGKT